MKRYLHPTPDTPEHAASEARVRQSVTDAGDAWLRDAAGARQAQPDQQQLEQQLGAMADEPSALAQDREEVRQDL